VSTSGVTINQAKVTSADNDATNGVVHIIDAVLTYPGFTPPGTPAPAPKNIVELAAATPSLSTLVAALKAADLVGTLSGPGPFTVFAPTNDAFAALPVSLLDSLLLPENKAALVKLLTYHVAAADIHASDILNGERIKTVEGDKVMAGVSTSGVTINKAKVISADNDATNGVVHVIDAVLTYPGFSPPPTPPPTSIFSIVQQTPGLGILASLLQLANLDSLFASPSHFHYPPRGDTVGYTLFAPTDTAFESLPAGTLDCLKSDVPLLTSLLKYHAIPWASPTKNFPFNLECSTLLVGVPFRLTRTPPTVNGYPLRSADNNATNGLVNIIDHVLFFAYFPNCSTSL